MKYSDNKGNSVAEKGLADPVKEYIRLWEGPGQAAELASIYVQLAAADASYANGQIYGDFFIAIDRLKF